MPIYCPLCGAELQESTLTDAEGVVWDVLTCPDDGWLQLPSPFGGVELEVPEK